MAETVLSLQEQSNMMIAAFESKDNDLDSILSKIDEETVILLDEETPNAKKYEHVMSIEYLLVRARIQVETESLKVKRILASQANEFSATIKGLFIKRDQYLAQVSMKLNAIRDEISNLQKVVYCGSNFIRK